MVDKVILGIDPGTTIMGYGVINCTGKRMELVTVGVVMLSKYPNHLLKLKHIFERSLYLIEEYKPDEMAIEAPFFGKNVQSMLKLGRAQGASIAAGLYRNIPITEYAPKRIKQAITGSGSASKEQVAKMLVSLLGLSQVPKYLDATDGLAAAVAHFFQSGGPEPEKKKYGSWQAFISDNPDKLKK